MAKKPRRQKNGRPGGGIGGHEVMSTMVGGVKPKGGTMQYEKSRGEWGENKAGGEVVAPGRGRWGKGNGRVWVGGGGRRGKANAQGTKKK